MCALAFKQGDVFSDVTKRVQKEIELLKENDVCCQAGGDEVDPSTLEDCIREPRKKGPQDQDQDSSMHSPTPVNEDAYSQPDKSGHGEGDLERYSVSSDEGQDEDAVAHSDGN
ncbi:hypothetical protein PIB30_054874 [Stylosanthes scabra]|uniref:Uncharacterized protein n=1 Tax=Stylosanthes scabra TaxID=79078 RepID=A0ABU6XGP3_9FABA|nr:hypothetical protein [Stylosanthes scabra]